MHQKEFWTSSWSLPERFKISWLATQNCSNWKKMHPDGRGCKKITYRMSSDEYIRNGRFRHPAHHGGNGTIPDAAHWNSSKSSISELVKWAASQNGTTRWATSSPSCSEVTLCKIFKFFVVRSATADSNLLPPTGSVNSTPRTSHFLVESRAQGSSLACAHLTSLHASSSCAHVVCSILRDSPFLFLLSIFSPIVLFISLALSFFFHDVVDKYPAYFC